MFSSKIKLLQSVCNFQRTDYVRCFGTFVKIFCQTASRWWCLLFWSLAKATTVNAEITLSVAACCCCWWCTVGNIAHFWRITKSRFYFEPKKVDFQKICRYFLKFSRQIVDIFLNRALLNVKMYFFELQNS